MLTCDLAHGEFVPGASLSVPGGALDAVGSSRIEVIEDHGGVSGVHLDAGAGALLDDAERVQDGVVHGEPAHKDGVVGRGGCVQLGGDHPCKQTKQQRKEMKQANIPDSYLLTFVSSL